MLKVRGSLPYEDVSAGLRAGTRTQTGLFRRPRILWRSELPSGLIGSSDLPDLFCLLGASGLFRLSVFSS